LVNAYHPPLSVFISFASIAIWQELEIDLSALSVDTAEEADGMRRAGLTNRGREAAQKRFWMGERKRAVGRVCDVTVRLVPLRYQRR